MPNNKVLIVGPSWVGDMVMAHSLCIDLKRQDPNTEIHVLAPAWTAALVDRMPEVTALIPVDFAHGELGLKRRWRMGRRLARERFTQAIVLPNSIKAALVPWFAGIAKRTGWLGEQRYGLLNDIRRLDQQRWPMTVQRFIALGDASTAAPRTRDAVPAPAFRVSPVGVNDLRAKLDLLDSAPVLALCPGAEFGASKQWPVRHYVQVAEHFSALGWQVWLFGSANDRDACAHINQGIGQRGHNLAGQTTLPDAVDLLSCAQLVVSNDSGLMHIAAALNKPLVAVYGSTDPHHTPPLSANHKIAWLGLDCSPCFARECPLQHLNCLTQLTAESVIAMAGALLEAEPRRVGGGMQ